jgi:hypothetical protein
MDDMAPAIMPDVTCPECGEAIRLVGIEQDATNPKARLATFECGAGHFTVVTVASEPS